MLELKNIVKEYVTGDTKVEALRGVSLKFRKNEFVAILGASGCGKTTLLNIVGGLDRYSSGDLIINGISTKQYKDSDWDSYRNHSIGFVFQSYNLIPHQTVLSNVELALTLSGVSRAERRARAIEALRKVGLEDQINKKPNQMSGGQMQRVAIARALVNNPDILLADEPTGALDTQTSVQIMDLLKEVAKDRLVIMVTHNPELADEYATRIVKLRDGEILSDSCPIVDEPTEEAVEVVKKDKKDKKAKKEKKKNKTSMSFATALSLSLNNLMTKKARTALTSFAGSIGIIGIALILSLSNGIQLYINQVQEDTLSTYPLSIMQETSDLNAMMSAMTAVEEDASVEKDPNKIYVDDSMGKMVSAMLSTKTNNLEKFKTYLEANSDKIGPYVNDIQYTYDLNLQVYNIVPDTDKDGKAYNRVTKLGLGSMLSSMGDSFSGMSELAGASGMMDVMTEMIDNQELLDQQYEVVEGHWPEAENEIVLVISKDNQISRMTLYMLGILDQGELEDIMKTLMTDKSYEDEPLEPFEFSDFIGQTFYLVNTSDFFVVDENAEKYTHNGEQYPVWKDVRTDPTYDEEAFITNPENNIELKISGIIRPRPEVAATAISSPLAYSRKLTDKVLEMNAASDIINQQKATPEYNVTNGRPHDLEDKKYTVDNVDELFATFDANTMASISSMMGGMLSQNLMQTPAVGIDEMTGKTTYPRSDMLVGLSTLLNFEDKQALALKMFDKVQTYTPQEISVMQMMLFNTLNGDGTGPMHIDSREDLIACMPSIAQDPAKFMPMMGILARFCLNENRNDMDEFYAEMSEMLLDISISKEFCVDYIKGLAENETADSEAGQLGMTVDEMIAILKNLAPESDATYASTMRKLGAAEEAKPASINFYAKDFASKEQIEQFIGDYNDGAKDEDKIEYTDIVGVMMSSVSMIIDVISYVLIAFVSISLVVSSIMIGIITYISVLERTKEIGILRSIGASKKDISRVFNAETMIIGFGAGFIGVVFTLLICIPINAIIHALSGVDNVRAQMPWMAAIILVAISIVLTLVAGLLPSRIASKKEPVEALRTE